MPPSFQCTGERFYAILTIPLPLFTLYSVIGYKICDFSAVFSSSPA
ncbi:hypothetical protein HMPREF0262_01687 [Clostridium sp. ATCC 29733]|nr:hypothetical protein HMPREF0262_01687 [Clostridium sp. ATCC 29733]